MPRVKGGFTNRQRHKKVRKRTAGFYSAGSRCYTHAVEKMDRALAFSYRDRKVKKREFRTLWNQRINAAARACGTTYSRLIYALGQHQVKLDRKILAEMAVKDFKSFQDLVIQVQPTAS